MEDAQGRKPQHPLLVFEEPTELIVAELRRIASQLDAVPWRQKEPQSRQPRDAACEGSLNEVLAVLSTVLQSDYTMQHNDDQRTWSWHYEVTDDPVDRGLDVNTVLSTEGLPGGTKYGRHIRRLSLTHYVLWCDD